MSTGHCSPNHGLTKIQPPQGGSPRNIHHDARSIHGVDAAGFVEVLRFNDGHHLSPKRNKQNSDPPWTDYCIYGSILGLLHMGIHSNRIHVIYESLSFLFSTRDSYFQHGICNDLRLVVGTKVLKIFPKCWSTNFCFEAPLGKESLRSFRGLGPEKIPN